MKKVIRVLFVLFAMTMVFAGFITSANALILEVDVTTPGAFTSPTASDSFAPGETITVSWGSSTADSSWGVEYFLFYFNGSSWISVANYLLTTTYDYTLPDEANASAQFRVYASVLPYGGESGSSEYRYSDVFTVTSAEPSPSPSVTPSPSPSPTPTTSDTPEQTVGVSGTLSNAKGEPIEGYSIELYSEPRVVVTNSQGSFYFDGVAVENHTLIVKNTVGTILATFALNFSSGAEFSWTDQGEGNIDIVVGQGTINVNIELVVDGEGSVHINNIEGEDNPQTGDNGQVWWVIAALCAVAVLGAGLILKAGRRTENKE